MPRKSKVDHLLETLPDTESDALRDALLSTSVGQRPLSAALQRNGHDVSPSAIQRWRERHS